MVTLPDRVYVLGLWQLDIDYLAGRISDDELAAIIDRLKVDLAPAEISG